MSDIKDVLKYDNLGDCTHAEIQKMQRFAEKCYETNKVEYARRGQHKKSKVIYDIFYGKYGEMLAYKYLISCNEECTEPDFIIYELGEKTYDADLFSGIKRIHVKCKINCENIWEYRKGFWLYSENSYVNLFPNSWLFQKKDVITKKPDENDYIFFVVLSTQNYGYMIKASDAIFDEPIIEAYKEEKVAIYEHRLI